MKARVTGIVVILLLSISPTMPGQVVSDIPRDTTYNLRSATLKIKRQYPFAEPAEVILDPCVQAVPGIVYRTLGDRDLHMDIYQPISSKEGKIPCILCIHGGGWASGNRSLLAPLAQELANHGYLAATAEYRLSPEARYPAGVIDVKAAVKWMKRNAASYGIDTNRIAVLGTSAGATIATLVGNTPGHPLYQVTDEGSTSVSDRVQAIINIDGILDFSDPAESGKDTDQATPSAATRWLGTTFRENPDIWIEASPLTYAGQHSPATLFINSAIPRFHAGRDAYIHILDCFGTRNTVFTIPDSPHSFWLFHPWFDTTVEQILKFSETVL
ncbi:MAG: alpha/beta hydrolase [Bacteroidales bacterium]|nr:alpha/beta hydrolase [Bacteroidales bacterium]MDT8430974.1 alpha/beta hydrolase [Bacteroidales bacterium]